MLITSISGVFYFEAKENKKMLLSENNIEARIYLANENRDRAKKILKKIILADDSTYSVLSLFLVLNQNLLLLSQSILEILNMLNLQLIQ